MPGKSPLSLVSPALAVTKRNPTDSHPLSAERRPSPGLTLNLSSNNPFRSRTGSPATPSPALPTSASAGSRPMSRNPFLATFEAEFNKEANKEAARDRSPQPVEVDMSAKMRDSPKKATFASTTEELFVRPVLPAAKLIAPASLCCAYSAIVRTILERQLRCAMARFMGFASQFANYP